MTVRAAAQVRSGTANAATPSRCARSVRPRRARTRRSFGSSRRPRGRGRRSCGSRTATPRSSCRSPLLVAAIAWRVSGDPVRALAVFVVATPCPLILAAPIALMSGLSRGGARGHRREGGRRDRAARRGPHGPARQDGDDDARPTRNSGTSLRSTGSRRTRRCGSRRRSIGSPRTRSPRPSSPARRSAGISSRCPRMSRGVRPRHRGTVEGGACSSGAPAGCASTASRSPAGGTRRRIREGARRVDGAGRCRADQGPDARRRRRARAALRAAGIRHVALVTGDKASVPSRRRRARRRPRVRRADARAEAGARSCPPRAPELATS